MTQETSSKRCRICGEEKPLSEFNVERKNRDGHCTFCKLCKKRKRRGLLPKEHAEAKPSNCGCHADSMGHCFALGDDLCCANHVGDETCGVSWYQHQYQPVVCRFPKLSWRDDALRPTGDVEERMTRNQQIRAMRADGLSQSKIGELVGLTPQAVGQILRAG